MEKVEDSSRIRILHIINSLEIGGAETFLVNFSRSFQHPRFELIIAYLLGKGTLLNESPLPLRIYNLSRHGNFTPLCIFKLFRILKRERVSIIHTHDPQSGIIGRMVSYVAGIPFIVTTRHTTTLTGNYPLVYKIENWLLKNNTFIVAISQAVRNELTARVGIDPNKVVVLHNCIDTNSFRPERRPRMNRQLFVVGSVGRLVREKGVDVLLRAVHSVIDRYPKLELHLVGRGPYEEYLKNLSKTLGIEKNVKFLGPMGHTRVKQFLQEIDVFVLPSRHEGFGIALIEAMAMSKPVLGAACGGIMEIIDHGQNGLLFESENPLDLAEKLLSLVQNSDLRDRLGEAGREKANQQYSLTNYVEHISKLYEEITGGHNSI